MSRETNQALLEECYFAISPLLILPGCKGEFNIHLQQGNEFVLYSRQGERFSERHCKLLATNGICELYVPKEQEQLYQEYVETNLGDALSNEDVDLEDRARLFHDTSVEIVRRAFETRLPETLSKQRNFKKIIAFVHEALSFLTSAESFKAVSKFISHDYRTFSHCVHVFLYSAAILQTYGLKNDTIIQAGIGAMLHDIGKTMISSDILMKADELSPEERRIINTHPAKGASLCADLPLSQTTYNCIQLHHEKLDGSGYPNGIAAQDIPLVVRAITIADIYDALTTNRPYAKAMNAFQVLRMMRDTMHDELDLETFARFVKILSGSNAI